MPSENITESVGTCSTCGKQCWSSKRYAKNAARRIHPGEKLSIYQCGDYWHFGHLNYSTARGYAARSRG